MIFDGIDLGDYFRVNYDKSLTQNATVEMVTLPGRPGQRFKRVTVQPKTVNVTLRLKNRKSDNMGEFRRFYSALLFRREPKQVIFKDDRDVYYEGLFQGDSTLDNLWYTGKSSIQLIIPVPLAYGFDERELKGKELKGTYVGTFETWPTLEAWPDEGSSFKAMNYKTGEFVQVDAEFTGSQHLIIDSELQQATINGANYPVTFDSNYFPLGADNSPFPTEFDIRCTHDVTMRWREVFS